MRAVVTDALLGYVRAELANGVAEAALRETLRGKGWSDDDVRAAFQMATVARPPASSMLSPSQLQFSGEKAYWATQPVAVKRRPLRKTLIALAIFAALAALGVAVAYALGLW